MSGHQEFKALSADEAHRAADADRRNGEVGPRGVPRTKHVEDIEDIWVRYFEAEHHLHWIIPPATEPEES